MFDNQPPRMMGMMAARNLALGIDSNPMARLPDPTTLLQFNEPGHPHREWHDGFRDARILMHMQQTRNLAIGRGLVMMLQTAPEETEALLIAMGKKAGETICIAILAALMETEGTQYDSDEPEVVLAIYGAMKQRMSDKPPHCDQPAMQELVNHVHQLAGMLTLIFRRVDRGTIQLDRTALRSLLNQIAAAAAEDQKAIASGTYAKPE